MQQLSANSLLISTHFTFSFAEVFTHSEDFLDLLSQILFVYCIRCLRTHPIVCIPTFNN